MAIRVYTIGLGVCLAASGCASDSADGSRGAQTFSQLQQQELEQERQSFISQSRERLQQVEQDINQMQARLEHEAQYVDAEQRADWSQQLFELKQDRQDIEARLNRAQDASPAEWREMRGGLGVALDSLEAAVGRIGNVFQNRSGASEGSASGAARLCKLRALDAHVEVRSAGDQLLVDMTTSDEDAVEELRRQARELPMDPESWSESGDSASTAEQEPMRVSKPVEVQNIARGVRFVFVPRAGDLGSVRSRLEEQARRLEGGRC